MTSYGLERPQRCTSKTANVLYKRSNWGEAHWHSGGTFEFFETEWCLNYLRGVFLLALVAGTMS